MIQMEAMWILLASLLTCGDIGTFARMIFQWKRDGVFPGYKEWEFSILTELAVGLFAGFLVWLITLLVGIPDTWIHPLAWISATALGYAGVDALEALLNKYVPES